MLQLSRAPQVFADEQREALQEANPDMSDKEITDQLKRDWKVWRGWGGMRMGRDVCRV